VLPLLLGLVLLTFLVLALGVVLLGLDAVLLMLVLQMLVLVTMLQVLVLVTMLLLVLMVLPLRLEKPRVVDMRMAHPQCLAPPWPSQPAQSSGFPAGLEGQGWGGQ
jgi:hypothetical protein